MLILKSQPICLCTAIAATTMQPFLSVIISFGPESIGFFLPIVLSFLCHAGRLEVISPLQAACPANRQPCVFSVVKGPIGVCPQELSHMGVKALGTRPSMAIKVG